MENETITNELLQHLVVTHVATATRLLKHGEVGVNAFTLYYFYCLTSAIQRNITVKANDIFCKKGLHWGDDRFGKAKNLLMEEGIIEQIIRRDTKGKVQGAYIKIHYIKRSTTPETQEWVSQVLGFKGTNALDKKLNTIDISNTNVLDGVPTYGSSDVNSILKDFTQTTGLSQPADRYPRRVAHNFSQKYGAKNFRPALEYLMKLWKKDITKIETVKLHYPTYQKDVLKISGVELTAEQKEIAELYSRRAI